MSNEIAQLRIETGGIDRPVTTTLRPGTQRAVSLPEIDALRRRVLNYGRLASRLSARIREQDAELSTLHDDITGWYQPEIARLQEIIEGLNRTKSDWFEPQLEARRSRIEELEQTLVAYERHKADWFEPQIASRDERIAALEAENAALSAALGAQKPSLASRVFKPFKA